MIYTLRLIFFITFNFFVLTAQSQPIAPTLEHLMTIEGKFDPPVVIDQGMRIVNISSGTVTGPYIKGTVQSPSADWVQVLPSGAVRIDVRLLIKTDDGEFIYMSYNGVSKQSEKSLGHLRKGEEAKSEDGMYFVTAPTFRTSSKKYDYLNAVQAINAVKMFKLDKDGGYGHIEVFVVK